VCILHAIRERTQAHLGRKSHDNKKCWLVGMESLNMIDELYLMKRRS
jgi:hypothetical protein